MKTNNLYNKNELYILNTADLVVFKIYDVLSTPTIDDEYGMINLSHQYFVELAHEAKINIPIILALKSAHGQKHFEDTLTNTKINLITYPTSAKWNKRKLSEQIEKERLSHVKITYLNDKEILCPYQAPYSALQTINNNDKLSLAVFPENIKPLFTASEDEQVNLMDYDMEKNISEEKQIIENLKSIQKQEIRPYYPSKKQLQNLPNSLLPSHQGCLTPQFITFAKKYTKKILK